MRRRFPTAALAALALVVSAATAQAEDKGKSFKQRFAALSKQRSVLKVQMKANEDPEALPESVKAGLVNVAETRMGIYVPPILSPEDMMAVVNQHMVDIRKCYKAQLEADPEWGDDMILDIAVKKTGRVAQVEVAPGRVAKNAIGKCLMSSVPNWKFPEFSGELEDGVTQEVVNASVPLSFSTH